MVDIDENLRRQIGRALGGFREARRVDQRLRAGMDGLVELVLDELGRRGADDRAERRRRIGRAAELVGVHRRHRALDEGVIDALMDIDAFHGAAGLAGIEETAIDDVLDREGEIGIGAHIGRILAAELQRRRREIRRAGDRGHDVPPAGRRAGEADLVDEAGADDAVGDLMRHVHELEHVLPEPGLGEGGREMFRDQRRLARMLHDDGVAGEDRRQHGVERRHIGIVPGRQVEADAERLAADIPLEILLRPDIDVGEGGGRDVDHVARALLEAAHLAMAVADRPAHLPGEQFGDTVLLGDHRVRETGGDLLPLGHG